MALPQAADIPTTHYDAGADNPRLARAQLKTLLDKTRDLINAIDAAGGLAKLDAEGRAKLADLFVTDATLRVTTEGLRRTLEHVAAREGGEIFGWEGLLHHHASHPQFKPYSFRKITRDIKGHAGAVQVGALIARIEKNAHARVSFAHHALGCIESLVTFGSPPPNAWQSNVCCGFARSGLHGLAQLYGRSMRF